MIKYDLICDLDHTFEAWFSKGSDFDVQAPKGLIECPHCASRKIEKAIMAPAISTARRKEARSEKQLGAMKMMNDMADKIRKEIADNCENVGENFAKEARDIHYGDAPKRGIYGKASADEARALSEEGIAVAPLPDTLAPKEKKSLN